MKTDYRGEIPQKYRAKQNKKEPNSTRWYHPTEAVVAFF